MDKLAIATSVIEWIKSVYKKDFEKTFEINQIVSFLLNDEKRTWFEYQACLLSDVFANFKNNVDNIKEIIYFSCDTQILALSCALSQTEEELEKLV